ncbi:MAG: hypothetical protein ACTS73_09720 [Arsenophonus sp. NEOnobi-MAG3]
MPSRISKLKQQWLEESTGSICLCDLSDTHYVYFLANAIYSPVRQDDRLCMLLIPEMTVYAISASLSMDT